MGMEKNILRFDNRSERSGASVRRESGGMGLEKELNKKRDRGKEVEALKKKKKKKNGDADRSSARKEKKKNEFHSEGLPYLKQEICK